MIAKERSMESDRESPVHPIKINPKRLKYIQHVMISLFLFGGLWFINTLFL